MLIFRRVLLLLGCVALFVGLLLMPAPWDPVRTLHGTVVSSDFGRAGRWVEGSRALIVVSLADGGIVTFSSETRVLPKAGDAIVLRQTVGVFGQTLSLKEAEVD